MAKAQKVKLAAEAPVVEQVTPEIPATPVAGLKICNETTDVQAVSIAYHTDDGWTSEGWWNVDPDKCVSPSPATTNRRYYYYRAEVNGGDFTGDGGREMGVMRAYVRTGIETTK